MIRGDHWGALRYTLPKNSFEQVSGWNKKGKCCFSLSIGIGSMSKIWVG